MHNDHDEGEDEEAAAAQARGEVPSEEAGDDHLLPPSLREALENALPPTARRMLDVISGERAPENTSEATLRSFSKQFGDIVSGRTETEQPTPTSATRVRLAASQARIDERRAQLHRGMGGLRGARPTRIDQVPVTSIIVGQKVENARLDYPLEHYESLRSSVVESGVHTPLVLVEAGGGKYHLLGGEHRYHAAVDAGLSVVPAVIFPAATPQLECEFIHLKDNVRRNFSDYELARRCSKLMNEHNVTASEISRKTGIPEGTVQALSWLYSRLPNEILQSWRERDPELTRRVLQRLAQLDHEAALAYWTEWRVRLAAARRGPSGKKDPRVRRPSSRPTDYMLARARMAAREAEFATLDADGVKDLVLEVLDFCMGELANLPFFNPRRYARGVSGGRLGAPSYDDSADRELPLPGHGGESFAFSLDRDEEDAS